MRYIMTSCPVRTRRYTTEIDTSSKVCSHCRSNRASCLAASKFRVSWFVSGQMKAKRIEGRTLANHKKLTFLRSRFTIGEVQKVRRAHLCI